MFWRWLGSCRQRSVAWLQSASGTTRRTVLWAYAGFSLILRMGWSWCSRSIHRFRAAKQDSAEAIDSETNPENFNPASRSQSNIGDDSGGTQTMGNMIASHQQAVDTQRVSPNRIRLLQRLSRPHTHVERLQAIEEALNGGMSLNEIEEILDWLDQ